MKRICEKSFHTIPRTSLARQLSGILLFGVLFWGELLAAAPKPPQPEISVRFDRESFVTNEPFAVEISVTAEGEGEPKISLPSFAGMKVLRKNVSRPSSGYSFSMSFGTGQNSKRVIKNSGSTRYDLVVMAQKPGKFKIGPVKVVLDGYTFTGKSYPIEVFDAGSASAAPTTAPQANVSLTEEALAGAKVDADYFLHMIPSTKDCTIGEMVVLDVFLFTSVSNIRADQFEKEPGTEGFWVERFEDFDLRNHRNQQVVINGILFEQVLLKKLALFPLKSGKLTIAPPIFSFVVGGGGGFFTFSRGKTVKRAAIPVTINVQPLPQNDKPANFSEANIGKYSLFVDANESELKVGEPITVTVSVRGSGNIRNVELPVFGEVDGFKMYAPETDVELQARGGTVSGMSQSKTLFIPEKEGTLTIPSLSWSYFDLLSNSYKELKSEALNITVLPGKSSEQMTRIDKGNEVGKKARQDNAPIVRMNSKMRTIVDSVDTTMTQPPMFSRGWYIVVVFGTPMLFLAFLILSRVRQNAAHNYTKGRSRRAQSEAKKALVALEKDSGIANEQFFSQLHKILLTFLENRLEQNVVGDTMNQLAQRLNNRGFDVDLTQRVVAALEEYEFARFAKSGSEKNERQADIQRAEQLIADAAGVPLVSVAKEEMVNG